MERVIRLNQIWSWLPAFRAVAETEHVHEAALLVHLTPSTLSRAIHLLEDDLGCALFRRVGRSLELTDEGRELLHALRDAMRGLDDAVVAVTQRATAPLRVAADDAVAMVALVGALAGAAGAPELSAAGGDVTARLLRGAIDVAFVTTVEPAAHVDVDRVGELGFSLYVARAHPLAQPGATSVALKTHRLIAAPELPWPPEQPCPSRLAVGGAALALAACRAGAGMAMLPDCVASDLACVRDGDGAPLVALRRAVYALRRPRLGRRDAVDELIAAVRARLEQPVREIAMDVAAAGA
jgi:DNA-binding transcriptional LysR family regulator